MLQQRGQMRATRVIFSVSPYQLIDKYDFGLLLVDCCIKHVFFIVCDNMCNAKKVSELMKNSIEIKYGGNGSYGGDGNDGSNGSNDIEKACNTLLEMLATYWHMSP